jgi:hypothetical protein
MERAGPHHLVAATPGRLGGGGPGHPRGDPVSNGRYCWLAFTKPKYGSALIVSPSFSSERDE